VTRAGAAIALLLLAAGAAGAGAAAARQETTKPFPPCDRSTILREEKVIYVVDGRVRIPRGVEISIQKDVRLRAKSPAGAFLEVEGALKVHGVATREVIFEGVTVVPVGTFGRIHLDTCTFRGGGGVKTGTEGVAIGPVRLENVQLGEAARVDLALGGLDVDLFAVRSIGPIRIRGVDGADAPNRLKVALRDCASDGLEAENVADLTVRINAIKEGPATLKDCGVLIFDGNKVKSAEILFLQSKAGGHARTQVMKCDFYSKRIVFRAPLDSKRSDRVVLDKCWFEGETDSGKIAERLVDGADEKDNNARAAVSNPQKRPLELAGSVDR
jgi:hypothetical protein